jgi:hypothetical protein
MRRNERGPQLTAALAELLGSPGALLAIGVDVPDRSATCVDDVASASGLGQRFPAAVWSPLSDVAAGLARLRSALLPAARVLLLSPIKPAALRRLRALVAGERLHSLSLEELCSALLLTGFQLPRVLPNVGNLRVITAELPQHRDELDVFFEQPIASTSR